MTGIAIHARVKAQPGREQALEDWMAALTGRIRESGQGILAFGFYRTGTPGDYVCIEQYADSAAALHHLDNVASLLAKLPELTEPTGTPLIVAGEVSPELQKLYGAWNPVFLPAIATASSPEL